MASAAVILSFISLSTISCGGGGGGGGSSSGSSSSGSLAGTTWIMDNGSVGVYFKDETHFYEASNFGGVYMYYTSSAKSGTYTFNGTNITFTYGSGTGNMDSGSVKIQNDRLSYGDGTTFVKQSSNPTTAL